MVFPQRNFSFTGTFFMHLMCLHDAQVIFVTLCDMIKQHIVELDDISNGDSSDDSG